MQNMAEGLNIGVKELRAVEQDYRKIDQLQKDKAELLKEAARQEVRGDLAKGAASKEKAEERNGKIADIKLRIGERLTEAADRAIVTAQGAEAMRQTRADAAAAMAQRGAIAGAESRERKDIAHDLKQDQNRQRAFEKDFAIPTLQALQQRITSLGIPDANDKDRIEKRNKAIANYNTLLGEINHRADAAVRRGPPSGGASGRPDPSKTGSWGTLTTTGPK